jgi:hypothetical protein
MAKVLETDRTDAVNLSSGAMKLAIDEDGALRISRAENPEHAVWLDLADVETLNRLVYFHSRLLGDAARQKA